METSSTTPIFRARIKRVQTLLRTQSRPSALLVSSNTETIRTRDEFHPFRQDSDFYYLTGSVAPGLALLVTPSEAVLFGQVTDTVKVLWDGKQEEATEAGKRLGIATKVSTSLKGDILKSLRGVDRLFHQNTPGTLSWEISRGRIERPRTGYDGLPWELLHLDSLLEQLRLIKDRTEVRAIEKAAKITSHGITTALGIVSPGVSEREIAATIEYVFRLDGGGTAFGTIAATGRNGATLHYRSLRSTLKAGELLLIDCGAEHSLYNGDITRTFPVNGTFSAEQRTLYSIVLDAQLAAIKKIRHNVKILDVYTAAAEVLTEGLLRLKVLKGSFKKLMSDRAYRPYFPHGIGHSLGLDVHDVGNLRGNNEAVLKEGMVFTVEPGLYFSKPVGRAEACGIRIEDDVLVTKQGAKILTPQIPKEVGEVEDFMARCKLKELRLPLKPLSFSR